MGNFGTLYLVRDSTLERLELSSPGLRAATCGHCRTGGLGLAIRSLQN